MKFFTTQVYRLLVPIFFCLALSIFWGQLSTATSNSLVTVYKESASDTTSQVALGSLANAGIVLGNLIFVTILLVLLIKYRWYKTVYTIFGLVMASVFGLTGFVVCTSIIKHFVLLVDFITLGFALYNFAIVGVISIFWKAPLYFRQIYLVLLSSLMAYSMSRLPDWTVWMLLGLLVLWDLFAVFLGPLKELMKVVQTSDQPHSIHMLVYTVATIVFMSHRSPRQGLTLGLGDFVFYSVLAIKASDYLTSLFCILAMLMGFLLTLFLLMKFQRPLPALPLSLVLGIAVYFLSQITLTLYSPWMSSQLWLM